MHQGCASPNGHTWQLFRDELEDYGCPFYCDSRVVDFVLDEDRVPMGVVTEDGRYFKANKAVVMACGGFEYNQNMMDMANTIGFSGIRGTGGWFNRGDGHKMVQKIGAEMWHMNNFSGNRIAIKFVDPDDEYKLSQCKLGLKDGAHDYILIDQSGKRWVYEESLNQTRHGKTSISGVFTHPQIPGKSFAIFGENAYQYPLTSENCFAGRMQKIRGEEACVTLKTNDDLLNAGIIVKCETIAEIAEYTGTDEAVLQETIDEWNQFAADNYDPIYHRGDPISDEGVKTFTTHINGVEQGNVQADIKAFDLQPVVAPYYVARLYHGVLNTQGGPRRSPLGEVLDLDRKPIPRLYAAGEFGAIYAYMYNLGGNFSECMASGRIAARNACALEPRA